MFYPLASSTWDSCELNELQKVIESGKFSMGDKVRQYEQNFAEKFGKKFAVMTSSGSAANLLAVSSVLHHPDIDILPGDNVIVPAVSWSTTYFPVSQNGLELNFIDIDAGTLNINIELIEQAINERTKAIFVVNLLGNPVDYLKIKKICEKHNILMWEDNCESMGASFNKKKAGTFGLFGTFSSFFSHHICTMEGGMVVTDDRILYDNMISMRAHGWVRGLKDDTHLPIENDPFLQKFRFVLPGYNLRPLELEGAVGITQLEKLDNFVRIRRENAELFQKYFKNSDVLDIQTETGISSWFGFAMTLKGKLKGKRSQIVKLLENSGIETRPIVTGNFLNHPVIKKLKHFKSSTVEFADRIDTNGFFVGNHHYDISLQLEKLVEIISRFDPKKSV